MVQKRRPRVDPGVKLRIVQLRALNPSAPTPYEAIMDALEKEGLSVPSKTTVASICQSWEASPHRQKDLPFEWRNLERAEIGWEAGQYILDCIHVRQRNAMDVLFKHWPDGPQSVWKARLQELCPPFTNRMAKWSWRIHQAAPEWNPGIVMAFAEKSAEEELVSDFFGETPPPDYVEGLLIHRPDEGLRLGLPEFANYYLNAVGLGLVAKPPIGEDRLLTVDAPSPGMGNDKAMRATLLWERQQAMKAWLEPLFQQEQETTTPRKEG